MPYSFQQLLTDVRAIVFPVGESRNLVAAHTRMIVDALIDIQRQIPCWQIDNTTIVPQCATNYKCGVTSFDFPRSMIKKLSVVDKLDADGQEDVTAEISWCSDITYKQTDSCHINAYWSKCQKAGCCLPLSQFFAIPSGLCGKSCYPVPTDEGVPEGLPVLPLGYKYPQSSTNGACRAGAGLWARERSRVMVVPWIQESESIVVMWDGIKREWNLNDTLEADPSHLRAAVAYLQWKTSSIYKDIVGDPATFEKDYLMAMQDLWHDCKEETRVRACEPSHARGSVTSIIGLYFNDQQQYTATCPGNQTGDNKTVTIPAGTVSSIISQSDANNKAQQEARTQAEAILVCTDIPTTYYSTAQTFTAQCTQEEGAPVPEGQPVTVTIPAGLHTSIVSQAAADALALAAATEQANEGLSCTFWNSEQSYPASCVAPATGLDVTRTIAAHTYSSTLSQDDADAKALAAAKVGAEEALTCSGGFLYYNTVQVGSAQRWCTRSMFGAPVGDPCLVTVNVTVAADTFTSVASQVDANKNALNVANSQAATIAHLRCNQGLCGVFNTTYNPSL